MNFTEDWFSHNIPNFQTCMSALDKRELFLEIGSYEGRATCWLFEHGLADDGQITCIDPHFGKDLQPVYERFIANVAEVKKPTQYFEHLRNTSYDAMAWLIEDSVNEVDVFDFIYIDGNHAPDMALTDACMAWGLLRKGGVMLFDDYKYPHEDTQVGIDAFLAGFKGKYDLLFSNYQLAVQKK